MDLNRRLPRIDASRFSMVPRQDVPRSTFVTTHSHKTTFNAGRLIPIHVDEVLPGDVHAGELTIFARLATPLFPIMDTIELETFFFFVPCRLLWVNWKKMMGERAAPSDSISYDLPEIDVNNYTTCELADYMGIPINTLGGSVKLVNSLPFRAYNKIYNDWFRDQNLQNTIQEDTDDGPDQYEDYSIRRRNKKHDYFTSALPWPLKGGAEVSMPLSGQAHVKGLAVWNVADPTDGGAAAATESGGTGAGGWLGYYQAEQAVTLIARAVGTPAGADPFIYADLTTATGATLNALRLAVATQHLLEKDARSGTRYTELLKAHFGVTPEDSRLQRPEYIGGGKTTIQTSAIPQTSATGLTGGVSPLGALGAAATAADQHTFNYNATEHGYIIGLVNVRAELTYQQGLHRLYTRRTRYDFYWPVFANLGEQAIRNDEIWCKGDALGTQDTETFGYQERWAEYRHRPSRVSGLFRSDSPSNIDEWHLAEQFATKPELNDTFIEDPAKQTLERVLAAGSFNENMQVLFDSVFRIKTTRPMPMYSVPGLMDRF